MKCIITRPSDYLRCVAANINGYEKRKVIPSFADPNFTSASPAIEHALVFHGHIANFASPLFANSNPAWFFVRRLSSTIDLLVMLLINYHLSRKIGGKAGEKKECLYIVQAAQSKSLLERGNAGRETNLYIID